MELSQHEYLSCCLAFFPTLLVLPKNRCSVFSEKPRHIFLYVYQPSGFHNLCMFFFFFSASVGLYNSAVIFSCGSLSLPFTPLLSDRCGRLFEALSFQSFLLFHSHSFLLEKRLHYIIPNVHCCISYTIPRRSY